jgi:hypothetical protein
LSTTPPFPKKKWDKNTWAQLKGLTKVDLISILFKDQNWEHVSSKDGKYVFKSRKYKPPYDYLAIHYHKEDFRNPGLLKSILDHTCWDVPKLQNWKIIK